MIDLTWRIELTSVILRKYFHLWNECEKIVCMKHGRPGGQCGTVPRTMACPVTRTTWRLPGTESQGLGGVSVTLPVAMMDYPWQKLLTGERSVHPGLQLWSSVRHVKGGRGTRGQLSHYIFRWGAEQVSALLSPLIQPREKLRPEGWSSRLHGPNEGNHDPSQVCPALLLGDSRNCQGDIINCQIW